MKKSIEIAPAISREPGGSFSCLPLPGSASEIKNLPHFIYHNIFFFYFPPQIKENGYFSVKGPYLPYNKQGGLNI
ncbi:MAG: hypothetical protein IJI25_01615 [Eubacterium sp.]|nr:hypothetical protein [Eubacterium sp.]